MGLDKKQAKLGLVYGLEINSYLIKFLINWKLGTICSNRLIHSPHTSSYCV